MDIKMVRALSFATQKEFAEKFHIPLQTLKQWEASPDSSSFRKCPEYVRLLLEEAQVREMTDRMEEALDRYKKKSGQSLLDEAGRIWGTQ